MAVSYKLFRVYAPLGISLLSFTIVSIGIIYSRDWTIANGRQTILPTVLGTAVSVHSVPTPQTGNHFNSIVSPISMTVDGATPVPSAVPVVLPQFSFPEEKYEIVLVNGPGEMIDGGKASFTWYVSGSSNTIHTSTIYYGMTSTPGILPDSASPNQTQYTDFVKDFMQGDYTIPIRFIGNSGPLKQGTYYYRAYTAINGKHYWSDEHMFVVSPLPLNSIKLISYPTTVDKGATATFTWEITGPTNTTSFTSIVAGRESKPGALDTAVDLPKTPYSVLVKDFVSGTYNIPIRLVGNARMDDSGTYFFRALTFINGKNIWSDEHSFTVQ